MDQHSSLRQVGDGVAKFATPETEWFTADTAGDNLSFAAETAKATGRDERTVQRDAERGEKVIPEVLEMIRGTKLDTGSFMDRIKNLPPNEQVKAATRDLAFLKSQEREAREFFAALRPLSVALGKRP